MPLSFTTLDGDPLLCEPFPSEKLEIRKLSRISVRMRHHVRDEGSEKSAAAVVYATTAL